MAKRQENLRMAAIMAGGYGERLWPLSRSHRPKQLLDIVGDGNPLLSGAVNRIEPLIPHERVYIVTNDLLRGVILESMPQVPAENILAEPCKRNTSACLAFAAARILADSPSEQQDVTMAVLTADHRITKDNDFRSTVAAALETAEQTDTLAIIGIKPTRPETSYGYIEVSQKVDQSTSPLTPMQVLRFREKPNREVAEDFISTGRFYWNSGMFFWRISVFLRELNQAMPTLAMATREMVECFRRGGPSDQERLVRIFEGLADISIDYGLMEKCRNVTMIPASFDWDDMGSWDSVSRALPRDHAMNTVRGNPILIDTQDCLVYNAEGPDELSIAVIGMQGVTVVGTKDAMLVCPTDHAQDVRKAIRLLKDRSSKHL